MRGPRTGFWISNGGLLQCRCAAPPPAAHAAGTPGNARTAGAGGTAGGVGTVLGGSPPALRLVRAATPVTLGRFLAGLERRYGTAPLPARGVRWSRTEFLRQSWVAEWIADGPQGERFAAAMLALSSVHGDRVPADLAVLEAQAVDFQGIETPGHEASWVLASHVRDFAGVGELRTALHLLYRAGWIHPLCDGTVVAPALVLEPAGGGAR